MIGGDNLWRIKSCMPSRKSDRPVCKLIVWYNSSMKIVIMRLDILLLSAMEVCRLFRLVAKLATAWWLSWTAVLNLLYRFSETLINDDKLSVNSAILDKVFPDLASNASMCFANNFTSLTLAGPNKVLPMSPMKFRGALLDLERDPCSFDWGIISNRCVSDSFRVFT